jgi:endonuclease/exonuclease/phosphatase family metal-dependent hydrolase
MNNYQKSLPSIWSSKKTSYYQLETAFQKDMDNYSCFNQIIPQKTANTIRIFCLNVHYWTSIDSKTINHPQIIQIIEQLRPDIVALQEVLIPGDGEKDSHCVNNFTIKGTFRSLNRYQIITSNTSKNMCVGKTQFGNVLASTSSLSDINIVKLPAKKESRSAIIGKLKLSNNDEILIINLHLDVYDKTGQIRRDQIKNIMYNLDNIDLPIIMMGDFNSLRKNDYTESENVWLANNSPGGIDYETIELVESYGFTDVFTNLKYSVWSGRRVDYIFVKNFKRTITGTYLYYDDLSDHISLIMDFI